MTEKKFTGVITALVTPFKAGGKVDFSALDRLIERQLDAGVDGLAVCATTGEGSSLSDAERSEILTAALKKTDGKCKIIAGTGTNALPPTVACTKMAAELGCHGALVVTPYYNKPTQDGLASYFMQVMDSAAIPVILYNVPSRTAVDMLPETVRKVASHENCAGIKDATGNMVRVLETRKAVKGSFSILSGDDPTFFPLLACGGDGIICTSSNVIPDRMVSIFREWKNGNLDKALDTHISNLDMYGAMFVESNPGPAKFALSKMGLIEPSIRPPLVMPAENGKGAQVILQALKSHGLVP
ncbi:MAG: 4-hydroxy-tetrahydrodipicolinate synthase [Pseudomonadota bacterium]